jgi:predicted protein tyrosine phosphatase
MRDGVCNPKQAIQILLSIRPKATLNPFIVNIIDKQLNLDGKLRYATLMHPQLQENRRRVALKQMIHDVVIGMRG